MYACTHAHLLLKMMAYIASKYEQNRSPSRDVLHAALQKLSLLVQARLLRVRPNPLLQESGEDVTIVCAQVVVTWHKANGICHGNVPRLHDHHVQLLAELSPGAWRDGLCMQDHFWQLPRWVGFFEYKSRARERGGGERSFVSD